MTLLIETAVFLAAFVAAVYALTKPRQQPTTPEVVIHVPVKRLQALYRRTSEQALKETKTVGPNSNAEHLAHITTGYLSAAKGRQQ